MNFDAHQTNIAGHFRRGLQWSILDIMRDASPCVQSYVPGVGRDVQLLSPPIGGGELALLLLSKITHTPTHTEEVGGWAGGNLVRGCKRDRYSRTRKNGGKGPSFQLSKIFLLVCLFLCSSHSTVHRNFCFLECQIGESQINQIRL